MVSSGESRPTRGELHVAPALTPTAVRGMRTAAALFGAAADAPPLVMRTAESLAQAPGQACLVSLVGPAGGELGPVAVAHAEARHTRALRRIVGHARRVAADAFSRTVQRTGGALCLSITRPRQLRLWLPEAYWSYAERRAVHGVLAVALRRRRRVVGTLLLWREADQPGFDEADQAYVVELAGRVALGLG
ncbi:MAG TPA: hypothetical protein VGL99_27385 [Chloroflexota bacterium]